MHSVAVIGAGYVGLTTSAYLAHLGHHVVCGDIDAAKIRQLSGGEVPIVEEGLDDMVRAGLDEGRLSFVVGAGQAVEAAEFVFLCLPTPQGADGSADVRAVLAAAAQIGPHLLPGAIVVNKSTVPVGTAARVAAALGRSDVSVVSNPEFLREGSALQDCLQPHRIVIASDDPEAMERVAALYESIDAPFVMTDPASAEMIKYASNAILATRLSFVNAIATLCEQVGADVRDVVLGMAYDRRIGFEFLNPGPGWGGSCFPKDTRALLRLAEAVDCNFGLLRGAIEDNDAMFARMAAKIEAMLGGSAEGATVAVWGLTFKAGTNDLRESPAIEVVNRLLDAGAYIQAYDPAVSRPLPGITVMPDAYDAARGADVLAILTEWPEFGEVDLRKVYEVMAAPRIVDVRNLLSPHVARANGFVFEGLGIRGSENLQMLDLRSRFEIDLSRPMRVSA